MGKNAAFNVNITPRAVVGEYIARIGPPQINKLAGIRAPRLGYEVRVAAKHADGYRHEIWLSHEAGGFLLWSHSAPMTAWPGLFGVSVGAGPTQQEIIDRTKVQQPKDAG